jgi:type IV secretory pathway TraG/TraD family ATPase VirD4
MKDVVPARHVGGDPTLRTLKKGAVVGGALLAFYLVLQVGARLDTGEWAAGGLNPLSVLTTWLFGARPWSGTYTALAVGVAVAALVAFLVWERLRRSRPGKTRVDPVARYLGRGESFTEAAVRKHAEGAQLSAEGLVGIPLAKVVRTGKWFWAGFRDGVIAIMGPGSHKTTGLVITGALDAPGPVWVTSNRPDVVAALYTSRADKGTTWVFDPQDIAGVEPSFFYDPLSYIRGGLTTRPGREGLVRQLDQRGARATEVAEQFAKSSRSADAKTDAFFDSSGQGLLANLLLAAALEELPVTQVLDWTQEAQNKYPVDVLRRHGLESRALQIRRVQQLHTETRDSVYETAATFVGFLLNEAAREWIQRSGPDDARPEFSPEAFVRSGGDTMICLSREGIGSFGPILAAMTNATIRAAEDFAARCKGGRLEVPLVFQLDEVANVCRIAALPDLVSHAGGRGIFIAPYLQSPAQGRAAWGNDGFDKLFGASVIRLIGRGLIDVKFLEEMSKAIGEQDVQRHTTSRSSGRSGGSRTENMNWTREPILSPADLAQLPPRRAVVVASGERAVVLQLLPWHERPEMAALVNASKAAFLADYPELTGAVEEAEDVEEAESLVAVDGPPIGEDVA